MPGEEWFIDGHILDGHNFLFALDLQYPVNQQERVAMRQDGLDLIDIHRAGLLRGCRRLGCVQICGFTHSESRIIEDLRSRWNLARRVSPRCSGKIALALHLLSLGTLVLIFVLFEQLLWLLKKISESSNLAFELLLLMQTFFQISGFEGPIGHEIPIPASS